ncbi:MAG: type II secretion system protein N, partial [Polaromonas sp.]
MSGLAVASTVYWGLKGWSPVTPSAAPAVVMVQAPPVTPQAVARALGGALVQAQSAAHAAPAMSRYVLVGVVA